MRHISQNSLQYSHLGAPEKVGVNSSIWFSVFPGLMHKCGSIEQLRIQDDSSAKVISLMLFFEAS